MKEPRSIRDILLDIAENPDDNFGKTLKRCPSIQKGLAERRRKEGRRKKKVTD